MAAELSPVYAKEDVEVGTVADIAFDEELQPTRLRMTTGKVLGLGVRILGVPRGVLVG